MASSLICEQFDRVCRENRSRVAIFALGEGRALTFDDLDVSYRAIAGMFERSGLGRGAPVIVSVGNRPEFLAVFLAALSTGAVLIPLDGRATEAEATALTDESGAHAFISVAGDARSDAGRPSSQQAHDLPGGLSLTVLSPKLPSKDYRSAAILKLTSGSTDLPKAALTEERHLGHDGRHIIEAMDIRPADVNLAYIPLAHSYGLGNLVMPLVIQGNAIALRDSFVPTKVVDDITLSAASVFPGVPFMFDHLCSTPMVQAFPSSLRLTISAGARLDLTTVTTFHRKFGRKIHSFYGSSETGGISYDDSEEILEPLTVGRPMPETEVRLRPHAQAGPEGGRIHVSGNAVTLGYAGDAANADNFCDGGFLTGDLGYFDSERRLFLTGRVSEFVNVAGRKIDPYEVERVLLEIPGVVDARVLGVACESRGQKLVACVVPRDATVTRAYLHGQCVPRLSPHKIPRDFVFLDAMPVSARGKTDRRALEALVLQALARS